LLHQQNTFRHESWALRCWLNLMATLNQHNSRNMLLIFFSFFLVVLKFMFLLVILLFYLILLCQTFTIKFINSEVW
jgi:hypothetical protein